MPEDKTPAPEVLQPQVDTQDAAPETPAAGATPATPGKNPPATKPKRGTYRPSHKATFIGLAVVIAILGINVAVFAFFMNNQAATTDDGQKNEVVISTETLEKLGVNRDPVGNLGTELIIGPDSRFNGKVTVGNDVDIAGQLTLNSKFSAATANLTALEAGNTSLAQLNVNGDTSTTNLTVRKDLAVVGITQLQGAVTINNSMTVIGNLTVGGSLFSGVFQANTLVSGSTLTIGGHIIVKGTAPGVSAGGGVGASGTVSISGTDASGTVAVNAGSGAGNGVLATVTFHDNYDATPHVVVTPVGRHAGNMYVNRTSTGFSIVTTSPLSAGGYAFDYIVMQ